MEASDQGAVPPPKQLTLERQLNKSILIGEPDTRCDLSCFENIKFLIKLSTKQKHLDR